MNLNHSREAKIIAIAARTQRFARPGSLPTGLQMALVKPILGPVAMHGLEHSSTKGCLVKSREGMFAAAKRCLGWEQNRRLEMTSLLEELELPNPVADAPARKFSLLLTSLGSNTIAGHLVRTPFPSVRTYATPTWMEKVLLELRYWLSQVPAEYGAQDLNEQAAGAAGISTAPLWRQRQQQQQPRRLQRQRQQREQLQLTPQQWRQLHRRLERLQLQQRPQQQQQRRRRQQGRCSPPPLPSPQGGPAQPPPPSPPWWSQRTRRRGGGPSGPG